MSKPACAFALEISDLVHSNDDISGILHEYVMDFLLYLESLDLRIWWYYGKSVVACREV
jgi:hypothetical protein